MINPQLYLTINQLQHVEAEDILNEYKPEFRMNTNRRDSLADIGTGSGDVLMKLIRPILPPTFENITGFDISEKMIEHCERTYGDYRTNFVKYNIADKLDPKFEGKFDHVTSFYCFHWVQDHSVACTNVYKMLRPNGNFLLTFLSSNPFFDIYRQQSLKDCKWHPYLYDYEKYCSLYHWSDTPKEDFEKVFRKCGFARFSLELQEKECSHSGTRNMKDFIRAVSLFVHRVPVAQQEEYLDDFVERLVKLGSRKLIPGTNDYIYKYPYELMAVYARK